jgi:hypothetical protein
MSFGGELLVAFNNVICVFLEVMSKYSPANTKELMKIYSYRNTKQATSRPQARRVTIV